jgi:uncharacterized protein YkwD
MQKYGSKRHRGRRFSFGRFSLPVTLNRFGSTRLKYFLGTATLVLLLIFSGKDNFDFSNGAGGADWKIGAPQIKIWNAYSSRSLPELRSFALNLVNRDRELNGLSPLVEDSLLAQSAQLHAEDMMQRDYYAHVTPEGKNPTDRLASVGGQGGVGENIMLQSKSYGADTVLTFGTVESFQKSWMYSDGHRANLLNPDYVHFGYGIVSDPTDGNVYAVQNFQR